MLMRVPSMTDSLKFGPEWLRNLSTEGSTSGAPKYQLAEHRYGREEMLALFDRNVKAPESLTKLQGLYVEKTQTPMALLTMTDEETRQWNKGINSDAVLRLAGKALPGPPGGGGVRGRGGSIDRGRGRLRGSGGFHYSRGLSYEEQLDATKEGGLGERSFPRSVRSYDRPQGERSWGERNGGDPGDWNGSTSPRKEYSSLKDFTGGGRNSNESWRRHRGSSEDEEGWRKSDKWGRSNSWRDETDEGGMLSKPSSRTSSWGRGWADEGLRGRSHDEDSLMSKRSNFVDEVPEWAMENPSESGGSFDATGAFHGGGYSDEEEEHGNVRSARTRLSEDMDYRNKSKSPPRLKKLGRGDFSEFDEEFEEPNLSPKDRKLSRSQTAQGNLSERSKISPSSLSKSQSSANLKTEPSEGNSLSSKRTEAQTFDKIRVQHQNFIDKNGTNKELCDDGERNDRLNKENIVEPLAVSEEVMKSETSAVLKTGISKIEKNSKENNVASGLHLPEEEMERGDPVNRQGSEEDMEGMAEVVKDTVVKLFEDEEKPPMNVETDKWYYRDPQGVVQGPFRSSEMLEWFMNGYFALTLLVRREQDEIYVKLGDLMGKCGKIPFLPGVKLPVLKADAELPQPPLTPAQPQPQTHGLTQPDIFMQQYHQYQILQKQFLLSQQLALNKLSQSEMWNTLSPVQQRSLLMQKLALAQQPPLTIDQVAQVEKNPLSQLIAQMQQQNKMPIPEVRDTKSIDPVRRLLQHMNVLQNSQPPLMTPMNPANVMLNHHLNPQAHLNTVLTNTGLNPTPNLGVEEAKVEDPIQGLLRQLESQANLMHPPAPAPTDSLWGAPGRPQHWGQPNQTVGSTGGLPLWEIKTEQQILAEQQLRLEEERRQEELRKRKEEEAAAAKKQKELEEKKREEEKREELKKLELKRQEEEKQRQLQKEKEELKKAEELKKKQMEEAQKKKQEMAKKVQEAQKKKEEKEKKKEEEREKKRLQEEGKKKLENAKKKKEEEQQRLKKKQEEEEAAKKEERNKRPIETLKKMQEMQMDRFKKPLPWSQPAVTTTATSLSDIQKMQEKEKKQQAAQLLAQQKELQQQQQQMQNEARSNGLNLKWAEQVPKVSPNVKSLAEIQAEEQLQLAKQLEKERQEREKQQREAAFTSNTGIWGNASQSLTWTNNSSPWGVNPVQSNPTPGFWDEVAPSAAKTKTKTPSSPVKGKSQQVSNSKSAAPAAANQKNSKPKTKKEEAAVMKLFERLGDEFTAWCSASLQSIQSDVDIPTFVSFLRDIESPYEVTEYVKCYLGDGKEAQEFAKQFLERRSRWMSAQKSNAGTDEKSSLSQTTTQFQTNPTQEFQEVKGKGKKSKKGKMLKVDNRILGFSVTAAPDRINIGDRDYVNHDL